MQELHGACGLSCRGRCATGSSEPEWCIARSLTIGYDRSGNPSAGSRSSFVLTWLRFLAFELDDYVRSELLNAISRLFTGQRYFTYNASNVRLDGDASTASVEDEFDANRQSVVDLHEFTILLDAEKSP